MTVKYISYAFVLVFIQFYLQQFGMRSILDGVFVELVVYRLVIYGHLNVCDLHNRVLWDLMICCCFYGDV